MRGWGRIRLLAVGLGLLAWILAPASRGAAAGPSAALADGGWWSAGAWEAQQGCAYDGQLVGSDSRAPVVGATVTVIETGFTTTTGSDGRYTVSIPGPGVWTVRASAPGFASIFIRLEVGQGCATLSRTVTDDLPDAPPPVPPPGADRVTGTVTVEGRPAARVTVTALVGQRVCGAARTAADGRYTLDVAAASATPGCGRNGAEVRFTITPSFGDGWTAGAAAVFQAGAVTPRDLDVDLRALPPDDSNVPWNSAFWPDPAAVAIGICARLSPAADAAVQAAYRQWREAARGQGLRLGLVSDADSGCADDRPGIAVFQDVLNRPDAIAGTASFDADLKPCQQDVPCWAFKSAIVINPRVFDRLTAAEQASAIAHEIGHALGLGHSARCDGGTIMWANTQCAYPLTHLGVDDIASLNHKVDAIVGVTATGREPRVAAADVADEAVGYGGQDGVFARRFDQPELRQADAWEVLTLPDADDH